MLRMQREELPYSDTLRVRQTDRQTDTQIYKNNIANSDLKTYTLKKLVCRLATGPARLEETAPRSYLKQIGHSIVSIWSGRKTTEQLILCNRLQQCVADNFSKVAKKKPATNSKSKDPKLLIHRGHRNASRSC